MAQASKVLIERADWVVTMDPERRILRDGAIAIENDRIVAIGSTRDFASKFKADRTIEASGKFQLLAGEMGA